MYVIQYEKTLPPWRISQDEVEAENPEDAVKEFYKRHDSMEDRKSVVQGKSVDLGGRRIIKKKKRRSPHNSHN